MQCMVLHEVHTLHVLHEEFTLHGAEYKVNALHAAARDACTA